MCFTTLIQNFPAGCVSPLISDNSWLRERAAGSTPPELMNVYTLDVPQTLKTKPGIS